MIRLLLLLRGVSGEILQKRCYNRQEKHPHVTKFLILPGASPAPSSRRIGGGFFKTGVVLDVRIHLQVAKKIYIYYQMLRLRLLHRGVSGEVLQQRWYIRQERHLQVTKSFILTDASPAPSSSRRIGGSSSTTLVYSTGEASTCSEIILPDASPAPSSSGLLSDGAQITR